MKTPVGRAAVRLFRGLRTGSPLTAGIGAALVLRALLRRGSGRRERLASRKVKPGQEIGVRVER